VASDAERAMGSNRKTVEVENSRHYPAPSLRADRNQRFPMGASDLYHAVNARFERLPLDPEDDANAVPLVANLSGIEYLGRMTGYKPDEAVFAEKATHFSPDQLGKLITNIGSDAARIKRSSPGLTQLQQAASEARQSVRSLILVKDHALVTEAEKAAALNKEVNHALQRAVTGASLTDFLGKNAQPFMADPLASLAQQNLEQMGYKFRFAGPRGGRSGRAPHVPGRLSRTRAVSRRIPSARDSICATIEEGIRPCQS